MGQHVGPYLVGNPPWAPAICGLKAPGDAGRARRADDGCHSSLVDSAVAVGPHVQVSLRWEGGGLGREYGAEDVSAFFCHTAGRMVVRGMKQIEAGERHYAL